MAFSRSRAVAMPEEFVVVVALVGDGPAKVKVTDLPPRPVPPGPVSVALTCADERYCALAGDDRLIAVVTSGLDIVGSLPEGTAKYAPLLVALDTRALPPTAWMNSRTAPTPSDPAGTE